MKRKHTLFENEIFDGIQWTVTEDKLKRFIEMWNEGVPANKIAFELKWSTLQVVLLVLDLGSLGKIEKRDGGLMI